METINIAGLGDDILDAMMMHSQKKAVEKVMSAAKYGHTDCEVEQKGLTPAFLSQLEEEGIHNIVKEDSITLFWEY